MTSVPPGVERSFERGAVDNDLPPEPRPSSDIVVWARQNITLQNLLIFLVLLFQAGGWWQKQQTDTADLQRAVSAFEVRLEAQEVAAKLVVAAADSTYVRRDVIEERLRSMDERLKNIETWMRNNAK